jgi:hypothetical protein
MSTDFRHELVPVPRNLRGLTHGKKTLDDKLRAQVAAALGVLSGRVLRDIERVGHHQYVTVVRIDAD